MNTHTVRLYHNPDCSKSRAALVWLQEKDLPVETVDYRTNPPERAEWQNLMAALDIHTPAAMMRTGDALFAELGLHETDPADKLLDALAAHPQLLQRPIAVYRNRAAIGRPTENLAALFD